MVSTPTADRRVAILGGGIAALEAVLALNALGGTRLRVTVLAPEPEFTLRPQDVARPFDRELAGKIDLDQFMREHNGHFRRTAALSVDPESRRVHCATGLDEPYDTLILAIGASAHPAFQRALTFGADPLALNGFLAHLTQGFFEHVAFVVPHGNTWPLPLYELALQTADEANNMGVGVGLHVLTTEPAPLALLGPPAGAAICDLLADAHIAWRQASVTGVDRGAVELRGGETLPADRVVALPVLEGPRFEGLPSDAHGFIPVDGHGRVVGVPDVYAAGDATDGPVKQGTLAFRQADAVAEHVATRAGAALQAASSSPRLTGRLLTSRHLNRRGTPPGAHTATSHRALWWPPMMAAGRYLSPYLLGRGLLPAAYRAPLGEGIDLDVPLDDHVPRAA